MKFIPAITPDIITRAEMIMIAGVSMTKLNLALNHEPLNPPKPIVIIGKNQQGFDRETMVNWLNKNNLKEHHFVRPGSHGNRYKTNLLLIKQQENDKFDNQKALEFLSKPPALKPVIKPTLQPIKRQTVHVKERNDPETPTNYLMPLYRGDQNHRLEFHSQNVFQPF